MSRLTIFRYNKRKVIPERIVTYFSYQSLSDIKKYREQVFLSNEIEKNNTYQLSSEKIQEMMQVIDDIRMKRS